MLGGKQLTPGAWRKAVDARCWGESTWPLMNNGKQLTMAHVRIVVGSQWLLVAFFGGLKVGDIWMCHKYCQLSLASPC